MWLLESRIERREIGGQRRADSSARIVGELGEVVPPRDAEALAKAMARMLDRIEQEPDIGVRVRERIETEFSLDRMVERTEQILFRKP